MPKYVRNPDGAIHSVADDFTIPEPDGDRKWEEVTEDIAKAEHAHLFGEPDPAVEAVRAHDGAGNPVEFTATGQPTAAVNPPVEETVSTAPTGEPDTRKIGATPEPKPAKSEKSATEVTA